MQNRGKKILVGILDVAIFIFGLLNYIATTYTLPLDLSELWSRFGMSSLGIAYWLLVVFALILTYLVFLRKDRNDDEPKNGKHPAPATNSQNETVKSDTLRSEYTENPMIVDIQLSGADDITSRYWINFTVNCDIEKLSILVSYRFWVGREDGKWSGVTKHKIAEYENVLQGQTNSIQIVEYQPKDCLQPFWACGDNTSSGFVATPPNYAKVQISFIGDQREQLFRIISVPAIPREKLVLITETRFENPFFGDETPFFRD